MTSGVSTKSSHEGTKPEGLSQLAQELRRGLDNPDLSSASLPQLPKLEGELGLSPDAEAPVRVRLHNLADALEQLDRRDPRSMTEEQLVAHRDTLHVVLAMAQGIREALGSQSQPRQITTRELESMWSEIVIFRKEIDVLLAGINTNGDVEQVQSAVRELQQRTADYERIVEAIQAPMKEVLGKSFLGTAAWRRGFGVRVGAPPPIPEYITAELLNSACPLHPGEKIKDTHMLVLMPGSVNGEPYSARKLDELSGSRMKSETDGDKAWLRETWANESPSASSWVLIPKRDPYFDQVPREMHFRDKTIKEQEAVYFCNYAEDYRVAKVLEVMTGVLLSYVENGEEIQKYDLLRTYERTASGGCVLVGDFNPERLLIYLDDDALNYFFVGLALARKPRS